MFPNQSDVVHDESMVFSLHMYYVSSISILCWLSHLLTDPLAVKIMPRWSKVSRWIALPIEQDENCL